MKTGGPPNGVITKFDPAVKVRVIFSDQRAPVELWATSVAVSAAEISFRNESVGGAFHGRRTFRRKHVLDWQVIEAQ